MKPRRILLTILILLPALIAGAAEKSVLFIGNSHTYFNDLPGLFEGLATAGYHGVHIRESTVGGARLEDHTKFSQTHDLIIERDWDHVVLQEHSLYPVIEYWRENSFYPSARELDALITGTDSHTTFFMTWGWEDAEGPYCVFEHCSPKFDGFLDMNSYMFAAYSAIAFELDALLVPAGRAWAAAISVDPTLPLWNADGYHPSLEGSYLAACLFYARLFEESPIGLEFFGGLEPARALFYQQIASQTSGVEVSPPSTSARLLPSFPNPFNPVTEIRFELAEPARIELAIFDTTGHRVRELYTGTILDAGEHRLEWDGRSDAGLSLQSGIYMLRLSTGGEVVSSKLNLLK